MCLCICILGFVLLFQLQEKWKQTHYPPSNDRPKWKTHKVQVLTSYQYIYSHFSHDKRYDIQRQQPVECESQHNKNKARKKMKITTTKMNRFVFASVCVCVCLYTMWKTMKNKVRLSPNTLHICECNEIKIYKPFTQKNSIYEMTTTEKWATRRKYCY